jgi:hypothetical protein
MAAKRVAVRFKTQRPGAGPGDAGPCRGRRQRGGAGAQVCETLVDGHERSKVSEPWDACCVAASGWGLASSQRYFRNSWACLSTGRQATPRR